MQLNEIVFWILISISLKDFWISFISLPCIFIQKGTLLYDPQLLSKLVNLWRRLKPLQSKLCQNLTLDKVIAFSGPQGYWSVTPLVVNWVNPITSDVYFEHLRIGGPFAIPFYHQIERASYLSKTICLV